MEKIIITGGTGFIGKHLITRLLSYGKYSIALVSNTRNFDTRYFNPLRTEKNFPIRFYSADIRDKDEMVKIFRNERAHTCIHLAAKTSVIDSIMNPDETININVKGTENILEACYKSKVSNYIFASSAAVYGDVSKLPISEDSALNPMSPYGTSKMLAEQCIFSFSKSKKIKNSVILRIFNVYGTGQSSESDVITRFSSRLSRGLAPIILGNGLHTRDFISVDDVVESMLLSIRLIEEREKSNESDSGPSIVFNIGTGIPTTIKELAEKMIQIFGHNLHPIYEKTEEDKKIILHSYADMTKSKEILHFVPKKVIDTGLRDIILPMLLRK